MKRPTSRRRNGLDFCSVVLHHRFLISHHLLMTRRGQNVRALKLPLPHPSSRTSSSAQDSEFFFPNLRRQQCLRADARIVRE